MQSGTLNAAPKPTTDGSDLVVILGCDHRVQGIACGDALAQGRNAFDRPLQDLIRANGIRLIAEETVHGRLTRAQVLAGCNIHITPCVGEQIKHVDCEEFEQRAPDGTPERGPRLGAQGDREKAMPRNETEKHNRFGSP